MISTCARAWRAKGMHGKSQKIKKKIVIIIRYGYSSKKVYMLVIINNDDMKLYLKNQWINRNYSLITSNISDKCIVIENYNISKIILL